MLVIGEDDNMGVDLLDLFNIFDADKNGKPMTSREKILMIGLTVFAFVLVLAGFVLGAVMAICEG